MPRITSNNFILRRARERENAMEIVFEINSGALAAPFGTNGICMVRARAH